MSPSRHTVIEQFTQQASGFAESPEMRDAEALRLLAQAGGVGPRDRVLDVACGPGIVLTALAPACRHITGIDLVPAMIEKARSLAAERALANLSLLTGDVDPLPFADGTFDLVLTRYSFHHFARPAAVLGEMVRVCRRGGRIVVCDVVASPNPCKAEAYNQMERWRDPSHQRALTLLELQRLFAEAGLPSPAASYYRISFELEHLLQNSFPGPGGADRIRKLFRETLENDGLGVQARKIGDQIHFSYPIAILSAMRPA